MPHILAPSDAVSCLILTCGVYGVQKVLYDNGLGAPRVNRDEFLDALNKAFGQRSWIECDIETNTKALTDVVVCLSPSPPYGAVDCPWVTSDPKYGIPCDTDLPLPSGPPVRNEPKSSRLHD